ncbi:hypothetical protein DXG01_009102 [Tephrocybe rancida]|nr:hypothetical protein DXG01_009102 [Tephrocybe rancida]
MAAASQKAGTKDMSHKRPSRRAKSSSNESSSEEDQCPKKKTRRGKKVMEDDGSASENGEEEEDKVEIVNKDLSKDILLIMSDCMKAKFVNGLKVEEVMGHWCKVCKANEEFIQTQGKRKAFHTGRNSSCRQHIRQHYELYKARCIEQNVLENHWAIPRNVWKAIEESKTEKKKGVQQRALDFQIVHGIKEFLHEEVLD